MLNVTTLEQALLAPDRFTLRLVVQEAELDELGHVNNLVYLRWIEDVARKHAETLGAGFQQMHAQGVVAVVRKHTIHYHRSAQLGDAVEITTVITQARGLRATRENRITRMDSGELLVEGVTEWVWINPESGRPKAPPAELLALFGF